VGEVNDLRAHRQRLHGSACSGSGTSLTRQDLQEALRKIASSRTFFNSDILGDFLKGSIQGSVSKVGSSGSFLRSSISKTKGSSGSVLGDSAGHLQEALWEVAPPRSVLKRQHLSKKRS